MGGGGGGDISKAATLFYLSNNSSVGITAFGTWSYKHMQFKFK